MEGVSSPTAFISVRSLACTHRFMSTCLSDCPLTSVFLVCSVVRATILCAHAGGFSSVQSLGRVQLFSTPWTAAHQASLSITDSQTLLKLTSIESVMPSNYLILCCPLLLPPSIIPSIRVFSNESLLPIRWQKD